MEPAIGFIDWNHFILFILVTKKVYYHKSSINNLFQYSKAIYLFKNLLFISRNPEFATTRLTTFGIIDVNFHFRSLCTSGGTGGPFSACDEKVRYAGTFGKRLGLNGELGVK